MTVVCDAPVVAQAGFSSEEYQRIIDILIEDLSDERDHPELWPVFPQFLDHFPDLISPVALRLKVEREPRAVAALTVVLALCHGALGQAAAGVQEINRCAAQRPSALLAGARQHLIGLAATDAAGQPDLALIWSPAAEVILQREHIYLAHEWRVEGVFAYGETVRIPGAWRPERFASMPRGGCANFGAFTYCQSPGLVLPFEAGRYCSIALGTRVMGPAHPTDWVSTHFWPWRWHMNALSQRAFGRDVPIQPFQSDLGPVRIGNDVWIGQDVLIKPGITIGDGAIVAAGSVVSKDVPPYAIVGGVPAKVIRQRFDDVTVARLRASRWWDYKYADFAELDPTDPNRFLDGLEPMIANGKIERFEPGRVAVAALLRAELG
ncbi:acetyltransferase-like isoleucine patch superfamily enzyme [Sphingomonas trueperi]